MFFRDVIGQQPIKNRFINSVKEGFIPHSQLISGNEGTGGFPLALAYARYLMCTDRREDDACGECPSCVKLNKFAHPDLHFVFPIIKNDKKKKEVCDDYLPEWRSFLADNKYFNLQNWLGYIGVENAQGMIYAKESNEIIKKLNLKTYESEYKIMVIWLPEKMHETCANKLLKIIEEPPQKTIFILISENPDQIIGTIQSRSQRINIPPIDSSDMSKMLQSMYSLNDEDLKSIVHLSDGSFLKAVETMAATENMEVFFDLFVTIMRNSWKRDVKNMKQKAEFFASLGRENQKAFFAYAQRIIRENFFYKMNIPEINYLNRKEVEFAVNFSPYVNERNIIEFMEELALAERYIEQNVNPRMIFFDLSMKIAVLLKK